MSESGQLQSMINDALPPSLDLVVLAMLATKVLIVKAPPTRLDSVTSEVEDDSYSIPSMTSSIQELINNNNNSNDNNDDDGFEQENFYLLNYCFPLGFLSLCYFLHNGIIFLSMCTSTANKNIHFAAKVIHADVKGASPLFYEPHPCLRAPPLRLFCNCFLVLRQ